MELAYYGSGLWDQLASGSCDRDGRVPHVAIRIAGGEDWVCKMQVSSRLYFTESSNNDRDGPGAEACQT